MSTVTPTIIVDGPKRRVVHLYILGDGGGDVVDQVIYDYSADTYAGEIDGCVLERIEVGHNQFDTLIKFDGVADFVAWVTPQNTMDCINFEELYGGIPNKATTPTGDITISTVGIGASEHGTIVLSFKKR